MDGLWALVSVGLPVMARAELLLMGFILTDAQIGGGLAEARYRFTPWLSAAPGILVAHRPVPEGSLLELRYRFDLTAQHEAGPTRLAWRALLERRHLDVTMDDAPSSSSSYTVLRNRIRAEVPLRAGGGLVAPFAAVEDFRDLTNGVLVQDWLMLGLVLDDLTGVRLESYYLYRVVRDAPNGGAIVLSLYWRP